LYRQWRALAKPRSLKISGHKTASMFQRYNIVATDDLRTALKKTQTFREGKVGNVLSISK
jgi:hypothetical protein